MGGRVSARSSEEEFGRERMSREERTRYGKRVRVDKMEERERRMERVRSLEICT